MVVFWARVEEAARGKHAKARRARILDRMAAGLYGITRWFGWRA